MKVRIFIKLPVLHFSLISTASICRTPTNLGEPWQTIKLGWCTFSLGDAHLASSGPKSNPPITAGEAPSERPSCQPVLPLWTVLILTSALISSCPCIIPFLLPISSYSPSFPPLLPSPSPPSGHPPPSVCCLLFFYFSLFLCSYEYVYLGTWTHPWRGWKLAVVVFLSGSPPWSLLSSSIQIE